MLSIYSVTGQGSDWYTGHTWSSGIMGTLSYCPETHMISTKLFYEYIAGPERQKERNQDLARLDIFFVIIKHKSKRGSTFFIDKGKIVEVCCIVISSLHRARLPFNSGLLSRRSGLVMVMDSCYTGCDVVYWLYEYITRCR